MNSGVFSLPLADPLHGSRLFLAGQENAVVSVVLKAVLENDRVRMPLVLWGPTGVGKTYLAEGLAETWKTQPLDSAAPRKVISTNGIEFARQYADAIDTDSLTSFRQSFRAAGLILIDNISPLCNKPAATREFCYLLDRWLNQQQLVICTSSIAPSLLPEPSLASRLCAGLSVCISPPELPTQRALLENFATLRSILIDPLLLDHLSARFGTFSPTPPTPRSLQAALIQLESTAQLTHEEISTELIDATFLPSEPTGTIELKQILSLVARRFNVTLAELRSSSRRQTLVRARSVVALLGRKLAQASYQAIGAALGNRDHSTIHHAVEKIEQSLPADIPFASFVQNLQEELEAMLFASNKTTSKPTLVKPVGSMSTHVAVSAVSNKHLARLS